MKSYEIINELKCWQGYHRVKGRPAGSPGSCAKNTNEQAADIAGTGFQQGNSVVKANPNQIQQDVGQSQLIGGTLKNIDSLRQGGPNTFAQIDPAVHNMVGGMKTAQTDVNKRLAIAGVGQTQQATQPVPASPNPVSQLKPEDDLEEQDAQQEPKPEPKQNSDSPMRGLMDLITTVGRAATSMQGRDLGADLKQDVKTMIRNKVTGEPNR